MNGINNLLDIYSCCVCFESMESAVSLNPCGHELDEGCANAILSSKTVCPICRADVDSFRPAYVTRQAVEVLLKNMQHPEAIGLRSSNVPAVTDAPLEEIRGVTTVLEDLKPIPYPDIIIRVNFLSHDKITYTVRRDSKVIDLCKRIWVDTGIHPSSQNLVYNRSSVSNLDFLDRYITPMEVQFDFYLNKDMNINTTIRNYPCIFKKAVYEVVSDREYLMQRFMLLYNQEVNQAMNSTD